MIDQFHGGSITPTEEPEVKKLEEKAEAMPAPTPDLPSEPQINPIEMPVVQEAPQPEALAPLPQPPMPLPQEPMVQPVVEVAPQPEPEAATPQEPIAPSHAPVGDVYSEPVIQEPVIEAQPIPEVAPAPVYEPVAVEAAPIPPVESSVVASIEPPVAMPSEPVVQAEPEPVVQVQPEPVVQVQPEPVVQVQPEPVVQAEPEPVVQVQPEPIAEVPQLPVEPVIASPIAPVEAVVAAAPETEDVEAQARDQKTVEELTEAAFEAAMQLIAAGHSVEQILGSGSFSKLPEQIKQQIRGRLQEVAARREMQQHEMAQETREKTQEKGGLAKLFSLAALGSIISKGTMAKITALFAQQPHLQQQIQLQGQALLKAGATPDVEFAKSNVQIAGTAPNTPAVQQGQEQQR